MRSLKASFIISVSLLNKKIFTYFTVSFCCLKREWNEKSLRSMLSTFHHSFLFLNYFHWNGLCFAKKKKKKKKKSTKVSPLKVTAKAASFETRKIDVAQPNTDYVLKTTECKNV